MDPELRAEIMAELEAGASAQEVADRLGLQRQAVAAVRAHYTRGTYGDDLFDDAEDLAELLIQEEKTLQAQVRAHLAGLDPNLVIVDGGKEKKLSTGGLIDILARADDGTLVVVELKLGAATLRAIGQVLYYVGALRSEQDASVRGMLVARSFPPPVQLAAKASGIELVTYHVGLSFARTQG